MTFSLTTLSITIKNTRPIVTTPNIISKNTTFSTKAFNIMTLSITTGNTTLKLTTLNIIIKTQA